jgi:hypothetical protein
MDEERQKKIFLMKAGIGFFMVLILVLWIFNLKNVWRNSPVNGNSQATSTKTEWTQLKNDLSETISELSARLDKIETDKKTMETIASSSLIQELIKETERLATSSASSTKNNNCPAYINCMPTIGEARPCQIPAGCEGITQIAY